MHNIKELTKWFLSKESMPHKKLQKLCYYAVAWHYALYDYKFVENDSFEAWVHGPISQEIWQEYKKHGDAPIPGQTEASRFDDDTEEFLEIIYDTYGGFSGHQLEMLTHDEEPWKEAMARLEESEAFSNIINPETMKKYYHSIYVDLQNY